MGILGRLLGGGQQTVAGARRPQALAANRGRPALEGLDWLARRPSARAPRFYRLLLALGEAFLYRVCYTMESVLGHLPRGRIKMRSMMRVHRIGGRIAIVLAVLIAFFCMTDVGAPNEPLRVLVHVVAGSTAFALLGIKFALIRWRPSLAYDTAPWIGRVVAVCFVAIWITSGFAYFSGNL